MTQLVWPLILFAFATILGKRLKHTKPMRVAACWHWDYVIQLYIVDDEASFCTTGFDVPDVIYHFRLTDVK